MITATTTKLITRDNSSPRPLSIYIPHIFPNNANLNKVYSVFKGHHLAEVDAVDFQKRQNVSNEDFYVAFVYMKRWYDNADAISFQERVKNPAQRAELYYNPNKFWLCKENKYERTAATIIAANNSPMPTICDFFPTLKESADAKKLGKSLEEEKASYLAALVQSSAATSAAPVEKNGVLQWIDAMVEEEEINNNSEESLRVSPSFSYDSRLDTEYLLEEDNEVNEEREAQEEEEADGEGHPFVSNNGGEDMDSNFNECEATAAFRHLVHQQQGEEWLGDKMAGHYTLVDAQYAELLEKNFAHERAVFEERQKIANALHANDMMRIENTHYQERLAWQQERQTLIQQIMYLQRSVKEQHNLLCNGILVMK